MRINLKENIVFPFSDPSWIMKTLIGLACQMLVVTGPILVGYQLRTIRQAANGEDEKLPEFDNVGSLWIQGFICAIVMGLIITLPAILLGGLGIGAMVALGDSMGGAAAVFGIGIGLMCILLMMVFGFMAPALMLRYAMTENAASLMDLSTAWGDIKQGPTDYIAIAAFPILASFAFGLLSFTGIGALLAIPGGVLMMFMQGRMIGNYYRLYFQ